MKNKYVTLVILTVVSQILVTVMSSSLLMPIFMDNESMSSFIYIIPIISRVVFNIIPAVWCSRNPPVYLNSFSSFLLVFLLGISGVMIYLILSVAEDIMRYVVTYGNKKDSGENQKEQSSEANQI